MDLKYVQIQSSIQNISPITEEFNNFKIETKQTGEGKVSHMKGNASLIILYQYYGNDWSKYKLYYIYIC